MLESASGGKIATNAFECLCKATDDEGFNNSLFKVLKILT
jgi:hypothetical protein|tara:strand:+ start:601 stop:720 length:120 start_codon:yes stop_codon:yes gene_type:complete